MPFTEYIPSAKLTDYIDAYWVRKTDPSGTTTGRRVYADGCADIIVNTGESLLRIAFEFGYYDHAHLTNEFKRYAGLLAGFLDGVAAILLFLARGNKKPMGRRPMAKVPVWC